MSFTSFFQKNSDNNMLSKPSFFYFYFPNDKKSDAEKFGDKMKSKGYDIKIHLIEGEANPDNEWSVNASKVFTQKEMQNIDKVEDDISKLAEEYGGDYDGHEFPVG